MRIIKLVSTTVLGLMLSISLLANQKTPGIDMLRLGEYDLAKQFFIEELSQDKAKALYYLGEVEWEQGNLTGAKAKYSEALSANPESFYAQIGVAKADLKGANAKDAKKSIENIYKKNKKDIPLVIEAAKAFYDNDMVEDGDKALGEARKTDNKSPLIYILLGDRELKKGDAGAAAGQYDQAINFDNANVLALIKAGKVYENINKDLATKLLKQASDVDPNNRLVNRYLAKIYSQSGRYPQAIKIYADYFVNGTYNLEDVRYFSNALYFSKNFTEAKDILKLGLEKEKDNFVFNRLMMYTENELGNKEEGVKVADYFFTLRADQEDGYLDKDYKAYGELLAANGRTEEAHAAFEKAVEKNPDNVDLYRDLASSMSKEKDYTGAADFQTKYINVIEDKAGVSEYYQLGRYYQLAANATLRDTLPEAVDKRKELVGKSDAAFAKLVEISPESYQGYYMQAQVNAILDVDTEMKEGLAKPYYEKMLQVITEAGELDKRTKEAATAYEYLAFYYYYQYADNTANTEMKTKAIENCDLLLAINPDKENIKGLKEALLD